MVFNVGFNQWIAAIALHGLFACIAMPRLGADPPVTAIAFAPDGQHVLLGSQGGLTVCSWPDLRSAKTAIATELDHVHDLAFSPDGKTLLVAGGAPAEVGTVEVLTWPEGKLVRRISKHDDLVYRVAWASDGTEWATAGADGVCQVFSSASGERLAGYDGHSRAVLALGYLPDGKTVASAGVDQTIQLWDSRSGAHVRTLDNHLATVNDIAVRPTKWPVPSAAGNGGAAPLPFLASVSDDRTVRLWQPTIGRLVRFARLPAIGQSLAWTPSGDSILVGCQDGVVRLIDPDTASISQELIGSERQRIYALAPAPGGSRVLAVGDGQPLSLTW